MIFSIFGYSIDIFPILAFLFSFSACLSCFFCGMYTGILRSERHVRKWRKEEMKKMHDNWEI